jgi:hypothetical protein
MPPVSTAPSEESAYEYHDSYNPSDNRNRRHEAFGCFWPAKPANADSAPADEENQSNPEDNKCEYQPPDVFTCSEATRHPASSGFTEMNRYAQRLTDNRPNSRKDQRITNYGSGVPRLRFIMLPYRHL